MIDDSIIAAFTLPCIPNHATQVVDERCPWLGEATAPPAKWSKKKVRAWEADASTAHLFYSPYEADNPTLRGSKDNQPRLLRALVADYDCYGLSDATLENALDDVHPDYAPSFVSRSHSGGVHALWMLESPVWVASPDLRKRLLNWLKKHLKMARFLPSLDEKALHDAMLFYEAGTAWQQLDGKLVTTTTVARALMECAEHATFRGDGVEIPLEIVAEEMERQYPGRWQGPFEENARGCRFWEDGDALSVIVKPNGLLCYTGDVGFKDWASLLGSAFVEKFVEDKIGGAAESAYYNGREFWIFAEATKTWASAKKDEMIEALKVAHGLSATTEKAEVASECDKALHHIRTVNRVTSAGPFVQRKPGLLYLLGKRHLNTATTTACPPCEGDAGPDDFPWIENFLDRMFTQAKDGHDQLLLGEWAGEPQEQLLRFLAWLQRSYVAGHTFTPAQGQVLVLAGEPSCGKTLLADVLIGGALGDKKDASSYLLSETKFSKALFEVPCWVVNDAVAASDPARKARYNSLVKRVAANRDFESEVKFENAVDVAWQGRLVITCNVDPESIQVMPQLDSSMSDKILALRCWGKDDEETAAVKWFGKWEGRNPDENVRRELPYFLRWLLTWEVPAWIKTNPRFGYEAYSHPELKAHADSAGYFASFEEILHTYLEAWFGENDGDDEWDGTATALLEGMQGEGSPVRASTKSYTGRGIGRDLANLVARSKCTKRVLDGRSRYRFDRQNYAKSGL